MSENAMTVEQWTDAFRAIGLDDETMHRWHAVLEERHPQGHESFLRWLGLPAERIAEIRAAAQGA